MVPAIHRWPYLQTLPVQVLKIDRQFVSRLGEKDADSRMVSAILGIADALESEVVAEGIETQTQYQELCALGCERGQGFLMAKPQPWQKIKNALIDPYQ